VSYKRVKLYCGFLFNPRGKGLWQPVLYWKKIPIPELHLSLPKDVSSENIKDGSFKKLINIVIVVLELN
jgi:hypothetical protein